MPRKDAFVYEAVNLKTSAFRNIVSGLRFIRVVYVHASGCKTTGFLFATHAAS
jgi:hypothetical protein